MKTIFLTIILSLLVIIPMNAFTAYYYCVYFKDHGRCYASVGDACYGVDADCNWLDDEDHNQPNP